MRLASVYPLVSSRAVARPFTYEVPDDVGKGAVVSIRFGRSAARGVVVETGVEAPAGVKTAPIDSVLYELPPALVDLALWVADYYGSTPARALELVAPKLRARRGERRTTGAQLRRDELERTRGRRAVVVGEPERELDEGRRQLVEDTVDRRRRHARWRLHPGRDDDAAGGGASEADRDDRTDADALRHLVGERTRDRARGDERIDLGKHHRGPP